MSNKDLPLEQLKLKANLTVFNRMLIKMANDENNATIPAFSLTNIEPPYYWIEFYKFTPKEIELLITQAILRLNDHPDDPDSIKKFVNEIASDPKGFNDYINGDQDTKNEKFKYFDVLKKMNNKRDAKKILDHSLITHLAMSLTFNYFTQL